MKEERCTAVTMDAPLVILRLRRQAGTQGLRKKSVIAKEYSINLIILKKYLARTFVLAAADVSGIAL